MPIRRRVYRQGNSWVISIPEWALDYCHLPKGGYFELTLVSGHIPAEPSKPKEDNSDRAIMLTPKKGDESK